MTRPEEQFLRDIADEVDRLAGFLGDLTLDDLLADELRQRAVLNVLMVIGEASRNLSEELTPRHPDVPWAQWISQRNIVAHYYWGIEWGDLWITATEDAPALGSAVAVILEEEYGDGEG